MYLVSVTTEYNTTAEIPTDNCTVVDIPTDTYNICVSIYQSVSYCSSSVYIHNTSKYYYIVRLLNLYYHRYSN